jgi:septal ring factor EnvC (AmiA/AmiB activator)
MMIPYCMREEQEPRKNTLEIVAAVVAMGILVACAFSDAPRLHLTTPAAREAREREQNRQSFAELQATTRQLQTRNDAMQAELAKTTRLLESTRSNLAGLTEGHNALNTQVATTAAKLQQFETTVQQTSERMAKFSESAVLQRITKERDDAISQSKQSQDQIRQLTLKLQKAGVYP